MCSDPQILSVYLDGELPSPWKEKLESHLAECPRCLERLESYRAVSAAAADAESVRKEAAFMEAAKERVWRDLEARRRFDGRFVRARGVSIWRRSVPVPVPAMAAAAALVIGLAVFWVHRPANPTVMPQMALVSKEGFETPGIIPVADMNGVLQYLDSRDGEDTLVLRLPESRSFTASGEPVILKAADYTRRQP
jgi:hypothetical protein